MVIEDDKDISDLLKSSLRAEGFVVDAAADGQDGLTMASVNQYDLIILDLNLPRKNGDEICRELRARGKAMPILMLSVQSKIEDKINLLNLGADDYVCKPFSFEELLARVNALLRRPAAVENGIFWEKDLILDANKKTVKLGGKEINVTGKEFALLEYLLRHKGEVVSKTALMENIWDAETDLFSNTIETHTMNLRRKLDRGDRNEIIKTVFGRGYRIG